MGETYKAFTPAEWEYFKASFRENVVEQIMMIENILPGTVVDIGLNQEGNALTVTFADETTETVSLPEAGGSVSSADSNQVKALEQNLSNLAFCLAVQGMYPDFNALAYGVFGVGDDGIDRFAAQALSEMDENNSIEVSRITGIIPGGKYYITDGVNLEEIQIAGCSKENGTFRITCAQVLSNEYDGESTYIYRTTADIGEGEARAGGSIEADSWKPNIAWRGLSSDEDVTTVLDTSVGNIANFTLTGDAAFDSDGMMTLMK